MTAPREEIADLLEKQNREIERLHRELQSAQAIALEKNRELAELDASLTP